MYEVIASKKYRRDFNRMVKSGKFNRSKLEFVIGIIARGEILPPSYENHPMRGRFAGAYECHVEPDLLLVYEKHIDVLVLYLLRLGSHSDLFD